MATVPADVEGPGDAELIDSVRHGPSHSAATAYGELYQRHVAAAYNLARQLAKSTAEADDLVSESFAKVLDTLRSGKGPDVAFRAYLLTTMRHTAYDKTRKDRKVELSDDVSAVSGVNADAVSVPFSDTAVAGLERSLAARAFATLPERWQTVLWHTEIEGQTAAEIAPLLGISANGVSALAYRAREGLRQAYLQVHLAETSARRCRATVDRLGAWTRGGLARRESVQVERHLDECDRCRALAAELADVNGALRVVLAPLVLGAGAAGYLAAAGGAGKVAAVSSAAAAGTSGAAGAASSAPRQLIGVGASVAALAAAIAVGAVSQNTAQEVPTAQVPAPAPARPGGHAPAAPSRPPAPSPPSPNQPAPPANSPAAPSGQPPASPPNATEPPANPPSTPPPGTPSLSVNAPAVTLVPGGGAQQLPITVHNTGAAPSGPVTATLRLPKGVHAVSPTAPHVKPAAYSTPIGDPGTAYQVRPAAYSMPITGPAATPALFDAAGATTTPAASGTVQCPAGSGTVSCSSTSGLPPGGSVTLMFTLKADSNVTSDATITGSVRSAIGDVHVNVRVPLHVQQPPPPPPPPRADGIGLDVTQVSAPWIPPVIKITVTNTGQTTHQVRITADDPSMRWYTHPGFDCDHSSWHATSCTSESALAPGHTTTLKLWLLAVPPYDHRTVDVTAMLGAATAEKSATVTWPSERLGPRDTPPPAPSQRGKPDHE